MTAILQSSSSSRKECQTLDELGSPTRYGLYGDMEWIIHKDGREALRHSSNLVAQERKISAEIGTVHVCNTEIDESSVGYFKLEF